jgi:predicted metalloendopeptidase
VTKKEKRIVKLTTKSIEDAVGQWYANGYISQRNIDRLMKWEFELRKLYEFKIEL